ncbi:hypothetical protein GIB67_024629 [Kingdonia uniflora]|uniref:Uncharacterized protein n=1 Tax=Kingdonia uniflora TaxID=39325 RepID=A0A7J7LPB6_9MAGN|nr:hypothetical protein GIB67_024629 [Kingdonia uniflora]
MNEEIFFKGNEAFIACRYEESVQLFSEAINHDPLNYVIYSKRSAAYACIQKFEKSLVDAQKTMKLKNLTSINAKSNARYKVAEDYIEEAYTKCLDIALDLLKNEGTAESLDDLHESLKDVGNTTNELLISNVILLDPHVSQTKGRKKDDKENDKVTRVSANGRILRGVEVAQITKRKCSVYKESCHDKRQSLVDETRELRSEDDDIEPIPIEDIMKN